MGFWLKKFGISNARVNKLSYHVQKISNIKFLSLILKFLSLILVNIQAQSILNVVMLRKSKEDVTLYHFIWGPSESWHNKGYKGMARLTLDLIEFMPTLSILIVIRKKSNCDLCMN